jgi:flavodoxin
MIAHIQMILNEEMGIHLPLKELSEIVETDDNYKLACKAVNSNKLTMVSFFIALTTEKVMNIIYAAFEVNSTDFFSIWFFDCYTKGTDLLILC